MQTIKCATFDEFMGVINRLARQGVTFEARTEDWTIELTGGF